MNQNFKIAPFFRAKENIEKQLDEQEQIILAARRKLTENSNTIEELKITTKKMDSIHVSFELDPNELKYVFIDYSQNHI